MVLLAGVLVSGPIAFASLWLSALLGGLAAKNGSKWWLVVPAVVSKEATVRLDTNTYSVPPKLVGKSVMVRADDQVVRVVADGAEVARLEADAAAELARDVEAGASPSRALLALRDRNPGAVGVASAGRAVPLL